jgi:Uma2 family endonuclease
MTVLERTSFITIEDYLAGEKISDIKHEYIGRTVHAMAGASNRHHLIATNSLVSLGSQLRGKSCQPFHSDTKVRIEFPDHTRFNYPHGMVVCDSRSGDDHFQDRPVVIVEVLSDSTRRADLGEKRGAYLTISSLKVLLFVEPDSASVTLHRRKPEGGFTIERHSGLNSTIPLAEIEVSLPLAELYERVELQA